MRAPTILSLLAACACAAAIAEPIAADKLEARHRECVEGNPLSCTVLAEAYWNGNGVDKDVTKAALYYFRACAEGPAMLNRNCYKSGVSLTLARDEDSQGLADAIAAVAKSCEAGALHDCTVLGMFRMHGVASTIAKDPARGVALLTRACEGGIASGCGNLADARMTGSGTVKDARIAVALYDKACAGGYVAACIDAGEMHETGEAGIDKDLVAATRAFKRACDGRDPRGCQHLVEIYRRDADAARALFKQACGDDREQCGHYEALIEGVEGVRAFKRER